ncbi:uncharacterized protein [Diabrotica undecimpunctata]|uniref:uncharacterized protein n=1 Tax=Diabrotica undecimpunctata TaxID=50387 RepID=UPI003B639E6E
MNRKHIVAMIILYRRIKRRKRTRNVWIHPINMKRKEFGVFYTFFLELREDENKFFNYFRMTISTFVELHHRLKDSLQKQNTFMRECINPMQMLAVTIRYLASGCTFTDLHYSCRLGISTRSSFVKKICNNIWLIMRSECIPEPQKQDWLRISEGFQNRANSPYCLGAVDGKHIRIINPIGSMYFNYKVYSSIVLMAVADSNYRFIYVDSGSCGKDCDSNIFKTYSLWKSIKDKELEIPEETCLPGSMRPKVPYVFIADEAFALDRHLLRPYGLHNLTTKKNVFNYSLSRARRYVEYTFGILSNKWRIFHRPINLNPNYAVDIVNACVVLHNFVRDRDGYESENTLTITGLEDIPRAETVRGSINANNIRNIVSDYFLTPIGSVKWQMTKISC